MSDLAQRSAVFLCLALAACTGADGGGDDAVGCVDGKCDGFGGAEQLTALSQTTTNPDSYPRGFAAFGNGKALFFSALKKGLWITDGTTAGTQLVRDLEPTLDSYQATPRAVMLGGKAYWTFRDDIWVSDGTPAGTDTLFSLPATIQYLTDPVVYAGQLVFSTESSTYVSDGTAAGTHVLAAVGGYGFVEMGGKLYFGCSTAATGRELCVTDATAAGTHTIVDLFPGANSGDPRFLGAVGGKLLFSAVEDNDLYLRGLYASDGTAAGTVKLIGAQANGDTVDRDPEGVVLGSFMYFGCYTTATGFELCKSDGTVAGTSVVDLAPGTASGGPVALTVLGNKLVFAASTAATGEEAFVSDGTVAGTSLLADTYPGTFGGIYTNRFVVLGDQALFVARGMNFHAALWGTDGTAAGTHQIADIRDAAATTDSVVDLGDALVLGDKLLFDGSDGAHGQEPWTTDGTASGTKQVYDVAPETTTLDPYEATTFGNGSYFAIGDGMHTTVWRTNGTAGGTAQWQQLPAQTSPGFTTVGPTLYYRGQSELWKATGANAGVKVADLPGSMQEMTALGSKLAFTGTTNNLSLGLWLSDGTSAGTVETDALNAERLGVANGRLWLTALYGSAGNELWSSDGTAAGTVPVADINAGTGDSKPSGFVAFGGKTLFAATDTSGGNELWATDGTAAGTHRVADISPGTRGSGPFGLFPFGSSVLFWASPTTAGYELWKTDGTAAGTHQVKAVAWGGNGKLVAWGTQAFFAGTDAAGGTELWRTDGTEGGTVRVADIYPGARSSNPAELVLAGADGPLYFVAEEPTGGRELWEVATPTGAPARAADIAPGPKSSNPSLLQARGGALLFVADVGHGPSLFRLGDEPDVVAPTIHCPASFSVVSDAASGRVVTFELPSATDNAGTPSVTTVPASGDTFMVGATTVTATAVDDAANTASCTFVVTVTYDNGGGSGSGSGGSGSGGGGDGGDDIKPGSGDGGCSTGGGSAGTLGLVLIALATRRRRAAR